MKKTCLVALAALALAACDTCEFKDPFGNCITKEEHERRVAHDAAVNALADLTQWCKYNSSDDRCAMFKK